MKRSTIATICKMGAFALAVGLSDAHGVTLSVLHEFQGTDGATPVGGVLVDSKNVIYGTTYEEGQFKGGTLFKIDAGQFTTLHQFGNETPNVRASRSTLISDGQGNIFGTGSGGGSSGLGVVFKWSTPTGLTVLKQFSGRDGALPFGGLVRDSSGVLYGSTFYGGHIFGSTNAPLGFGSIFRITPDGTFAQLHSFNGTDGYGPQHRLTVHDGFLYGGTVYGQPVSGNIFRITQSGQQFSVVKPSAADGYNFVGGMVSDQAGNLYGAVMNTSVGGIGAIYKIDSTGKYQLIHKFTGPDGAYPSSELLLIGDRLFGTTNGLNNFKSANPPGGGFGTVFEINIKTNVFTTLHQFTGPDGANPAAGLTVDASGNLIGSAQYGGKFGKGVIFRIGAVGLPVSTPSNSIAVKEVIFDANAPKVVITNGAIFSLTSIQNLNTKSMRLTRPLMASPNGPLGPLPSQVDLTRFQTGFRNQGGRDLCTVFADIAAIEAVYKRRYNLDLDLSEQYFNHVQKMAHVDTNAILPQRENQVGAWGGSRIVHNLNVLKSGYGIPLEKDLPYIPMREFGNDEPGDNPAIMNPFVPITQRQVDDFNLSPSAVEYRIPQLFRTTNLPQKALESAIYRSTGFYAADSNELKSLDWYRKQLAANREVVIELKCCGDIRYGSNDVWSPNGTESPTSSHAVLIVGYNDQDRTFTIKNQWGEDKFRRFSYDWVTNGLIDDAVVITDVADPALAASAFSTAQLFIGRWNLDFDGWHGILDIYHLPFPGGSDRRLGTFYRPDGTAQRVNGRITGNQIEFYLDPDQANSAITALKGMYFAGYLFSYDRAYMAGRMKDSRDGNTYSFYATKAAALSGKARQGVFTPASYLGYWKMNHDGWVGDLAIEKVNVKTGGVTGHYSSAGVTSPVRGRIDLATMLFTFTVQSSRPQSFWMSILSHERGIMAGTTNWAGFTFGAWAQRTADGGMTTLANIGPPVSNDEGFPPVCKKKPYLPQCNN